MQTIYFLLYVLALICFGIAAAGKGGPRPVLVPLGLAFWVLVPLLVQWKVVKA